MKLSETRPNVLSLRYLQTVPNKKEAAKACILVNILLRQHDCITSVTLSSNIMTNDYSDIVCDALGMNSGVRKLSFSADDFDDINGGVIENVCLMRNLTSLCLVDVLIQPSLVTFFCAVAERTRALYVNRVVEHGNYWRRGVFCNM